MISILYSTFTLIVQTNDSYGVIVMTVLISCRYNFNSASPKTTNNVFWGKKLVGANNLSESWPSLKYGLVKR